MLQEVDWILRPAFPPEKNGKTEKIKSKKRKPFHFLENVKSCVRGAFVTSPSAAPAIARNFLGSAGSIKRWNPSGTRKPSSGSYRQAFWQSCGTFQGSKNSNLNIMNSF